VSGLVYFDPLAGLLFILWSWPVRQLASDSGESCSLREAEKDRRAATVDDGEEHGCLSRGSSCYFRDGCKSSFTLLIKSNPSLLEKKLLKKTNQRAILLSTTPRARPGRRQAPARARLPAGERGEGSYPMAWPRGQAR